MRRIYSLALAGCLLIAAAPASPQAQDENQNPQSAAANYELGPGDVLDVLVPTHEGFNSALTVQPDGRIYYPFVGEIVVTGLTVPDLTRRIREGLEKELKHPQVNVSVRQVRPGASRITITGAVRTQSGVELRPNWRVSDAILAAGGPTDRADLTRVTWWHEGKPETLDLSPLKIDGRLDRNPLLSVGDVLIVPERERLTVSVTGEGVRNQGSFELDDPEPTVLKAVQKAGGQLDRADLKRALIIRAGQSPQPLDL
jgi:polysaccharide export outer membrane protein